ncbi:hypothetical protein ITI46_32130 [Streptomyces oryzae]|uniref:Carrier domain-containing protein n=2 Tax=Streptomyces oryzae TaxID=1434886 RepID=A0ABS3XLR9_9ACTN|nr:hypothetical protein [Streptomyces oryzae]
MPQPPDAVPEPQAAAPGAVPQPLPAVDAGPAPDAGPAVDEPRQGPAAEQPAARADRERIKSLTTQRLARALRVPPGELSPRRAFAELGVDSITGMSFVAELGEELGLELDAALLYDHTTIDRLTDHLTDLVDNASGGQR